MFGMYMQESCHVKNGNVRLLMYSEERYLLFLNTLALFRKVIAIIRYVIALFCNIFHYYALFVPFRHVIALFQYYNFILHYCVFAIVLRFNS